MVLVSDIHMQGCHSLVILQRLVLLLTSCWRLACVSWGKSGHLALKIAEDNWLLRSLQSVCGLRGNKSVCELLVSLSNMWLRPVFTCSLSPKLWLVHPKCNPSQIQVGFRWPVCGCTLVLAMLAPGTVPQWDLGCAIHSSPWLGLSCQAVEALLDWTVFTKLWCVHGINAKNQQEPACVHKGQDWWLCNTLAWDRPSYQGR